MKKLLIALASAVAITGAAKAAGSGVGHTTTFEALSIGSAFNAANDDDGTGTGAKYWAIAEGADDNYATVTNVDFKNTAPHTTTNNSAKALAIDTSARLSRQVNPGSEGTESFASTSLYFDGYVQFTAADSLPTTEAGDKLVVWLYGGDEDTDDAVAAALGLENKATTNLVITAALVAPNGTLTATNFLVSGVSVLPDQWKRLTIKAFVEDSLPKFKVYIDGTQVSSGDTSVFNSLVMYNADNATTLTSVSFEGTGAVDDLGFTAADLFPDAVAETFDFTLSYPSEGIELIAFEADKEYEVSASGETYDIPVGTSGITVMVAPASGYTVTNQGATLVDEGVYSIAIDTSAATAESTFSLEVTVSGGGSSDYPSYIDGIEDAATKAAYQTKYDAWKGTYSADTTSTHGDQFLLNIAPSATAELETATIVIENGAVKITTSPAANSVNGKVYIKTATTLQGLSEANWDEATLSEGVIQVTPGSGATAGFYKVKVDF